MTDQFIQQLKNEDDTELTDEKFNQKLLQKSENTQKK
jgi:hypothetical protein